jgi:hypothetical protein
MTSKNDVLTDIDDFSSKILPRRHAANRPSASQHSNQFPVRAS